jgi:predicted XRE-type DNA-binding protein
MHRDNPIPALKRQLGAELARHVRDWNADDIAFMIGTDRWRIADLRRGKLDRFSLETLIRYLARLRQDVDVTVTPVRINKSIGRRDESPPRRVRIQIPRDLVRPDTHND